MSTDKVTGSCLCGQVSFEIQKPFFFFQYCHCSRCRKSTGSPHGANIFLKLENFKWLQGESLVKRFELPSARFFCTGFCSHCGSSLPWVTRNGKYMLVPAGALDEDPGEKPTRNIHWASRAPWYDAVENLPYHDAEPK